ncbi:MAG TPA: hypothetical protein VGN42_16995 [Pirellulales bacterium]|nr:hypothetical protein [Pirellulales bacterium]
MHRLFSGMSIGLLALAFGQAAQRADGNEWVGREVMARSPTEMPRIGRCASSVQCIKIYTVEQIQGEWLWVGDGWMRSRDAVAADEASDWFTAEIEKRPSVFAYCSRATVRSDREDWDG